jgi:hypothetical protein
MGWDWKHEMRQAEADFRDIVVPAIRRGLPQGQYYSTQSDGLTSPSAGLLDRKAGIDWLVEHETGVTSVAERVSYMRTPTLSFTFNEHELRKRLSFTDPMTSADLGPTHTVQAYLREPGKDPSSPRSP